MNVSHVETLKRRRPWDLQWTSVWQKQRHYDNNAVCFRGPLPRVRSGSVGETVGPSSSSGAIAVHSLAIITMACFFVGSIIQHTFCSVSQPCPEERTSRYIWSQLHHKVFLNHTIIHTFSNRKIHRYTWIVWIEKNRKLIIVCYVQKTLWNKLRWEDLLRHLKVMCIFIMFSYNLVTFNEVTSTPTVDA